VIEITKANLTKVLSLELMESAERSISSTQVITFIYLFHSITLYAYSVESIYSPSKINKHCNLGNKRS
jgi:hypothetical protein